MHKVPAFIKFKLKKYTNETEHDNFSHIRGMHIARFHETIKK
ncbi:hypothetical protein SAMN05444277_101551 [Parafilimonas terrae]|uniref:Uncharacterized protein n=1 Tax=Parafilimonas terrae TaxID=1465490 RepID=A0A1I5S2P0_9BACT|nr:hypothetical protein SAMN05444277_101551 [Parafilimonas terrae]